MTDRAVRWRSAPPTWISKSVEQVTARVERTGRTTAPAHTLYDIVRKLPDGAQIELDASGERNSMVLRCGRSTFTLACLPPEDYPIMAGGELPHNFTLTAAELKSLIDRTRFRDLNRRDPLLSQRHLSACHQE